MSKRGYIQDPAGFLGVISMWVAGAGVFRSTQNLTVTREHVRIAADLCSRLTGDVTEDNITDTLNVIRYEIARAKAAGRKQVVLWFGPESDTAA